MQTNTALPIQELVAQTRASQLAEAGLPPNFRGNVDTELALRASVAAVIDGLDLKIKSAAERGATDVQLLEIGYCKPKTNALLVLFGLVDKVTDRQLIEKSPALCNLWDTLEEKGAKPFLEHYDPSYYSFGSSHISIRI